MAFSPETALNYLRRAHEQKRLGHAYLISGGPGSGKRTLAAKLTKAVNGTEPEDVFSSRAREVFVAEPESKSRRIVTEQIRALEHALQMRSAEGQKKVAIISEADRLQPQAANAFLKTLEEPPDNSLLLLLTSLPETLPDTILSRCISIPLAAESSSRSAEENELIQVLGQAASQENWSIDHGYRIAQRLQRLLAGIREQIKQAHGEALKSEEARYQNSTDGAWLENREDYYKALTESRYVQRRNQLIEVLFLFFGDLLRVRNGIADKNLPELARQTARVAERFTNAEILRRIRRLEELRDHLSRNIQETLAIEVAFLNIFGS